MRTVFVMVLAGCATADSVDTIPQIEQSIPSLCINELQPDNDSTLEVDGVFPDWVELHNPTDQDVPLDGWSISESRSPDVWLFDRVIPARGFLVLTADDELPDADLPFNLDSDGQDLQLIDPLGGGRRVEWSHIRGDNSAARVTDCCEGNCWEVSELPSPGAPN